jgi:hypothetical protein
MNGGSAADLSNFGDLAASNLYNSPIPYLPFLASLSASVSWGA